MSSGVVSTLSKFIVIKSNYFSTKGYASFKKDDGSVLLGEKSVFSPYAKIEAERATSTSGPEEDTTKSSCTLFEAVRVDSTKKWFYLKHVPSGGRLLIDPETMAFFAEHNPRDEQGYLSYVDWDSLVRLPKEVAFKGHNGSWLGGILSKKVNYLQYSVDDPNTPITTYKIELANDGHVRIFSDYFNKYCRRGHSDWIVADFDGKSGNDPNALFWPVKIDETTIALRNAGNKHFCVGLDAENKTRCLNASVPNISSRAKIELQELVLSRKVYNVRYRMEDARIFGERPYVAGTTAATNYGDKPTVVVVEVMYIDEKAYKFSNSTSLTAGIKTTFEAGLPKIGGGSLEVSFETEKTMEWEQTTTTTTSVKATGSVTVPAMSVATISYVGTKGTCDVPFTYTQKDNSSLDGATIETDHIDGVFKGVNAYNFDFVVAKAHPVPA